MSDSGATQRAQPVAARCFDPEYARQPGETLLQVYRDAYGDDYPQEVEPYSFLTKTDLARILQLLATGPGKVLVDLGCGRAGPGLWLARESGADLIGIDLSANALRSATQRAGDFAMAGRARFVRADLCATTLPAQSCDGATSIDVFMFIQDKNALMREVARILMPGAPFVFVTFERKESQTYSTALRENGFAVEVCEETPLWRPRRLGLYRGILAKQDALLREMGEGFRAVIKEATEGLADGLGDRIRVLIAARRLEIVRRPNKSLE